ncbi:uncharacterized protein SCHCODRAFT_02610836 [Schizophyllum commune H4-8]|nr:uncharacterized protein SCHCODRAFT_02610836 [Schizophyllum commune H4-8]KAI5897999.1 hypothetical protein SCHCODRAFT_02610836 [Schizophyllum commune H4-8]
MTVSAELATTAPVLEKVTTVHRQLSDTEASYFLPARANGVNDMYLHLGFHAPASLMRRSRVRLVWALLRLRHPLLASQVDMRDYEDIRFVYTPPPTLAAALGNADQALEYRAGDKDALIDAYLNGPRTLHNERLSYLILSDTAGTALPTPPASPGPLDTSPNNVPNHDILICATHFLGDGMALHTFANDFFGLLGGGASEDELSKLVEDEWRAAVRRATDGKLALPAATEDRLPASPESRLRRAAERVDYQRYQEKQIGGHAFPRAKGKERHTIVPTVPFSADRTKAMLKRCKEHGVSISAALFAICNIAWARTANGNWELPMMMYSALNMRPYLLAEKALNQSYWFLAVGYFNVVLPSFLPADAAKTFWLRARAAKAQSTRAAKSPMLVPRARETARERGVRARQWAREDDGVAAPPASKPASAPTPSTAPKIPSTALIGLSLLGNLDGMYKHATFGSIKMHTLTTGSRQRAGGMLLFGYTFAGKLWVSLGYDENGFEKETVQAYWRRVLEGIEEFLG